MKGLNAVRKLAVYAPEAEQVLIVDANNRRVGAMTRKEMVRCRQRAKNLIHRSTFIFISNSRDQLYVQKRTSTKDIYPGYHDFAPGGIVLASDESDVKSAQRELEEEMGIANADLEHLFDFYYEDWRTKEWGACFFTRWDGPVKLQKEEVESVRLMSLGEIEAEVQKGVKYSPDSLVALPRFTKLGKLQRPKL